MIDAFVLSVDRGTNGFALTTNSAALSVGNNSAAH